jgi:hypothetical protein
LLQTVTIPAVLLHCHSAFRLESIGLIHWMERKAAQMKVTIAMRAICPRDRNITFIAFTPH